MFSRYRKLLLSLLVLSLIFFSTTPLVGMKISAAQDEKVSPDISVKLEDKLNNPEYIEERLQELQIMLNDWKGRDKELVAGQYGISETDVVNRIALLGSVESFYRRLSTALEKNSSLSLELSRLEETRGQPVESIIEKDPPYNLSFYETYLDKIEVIDQRIKSLQNSIKQLRSGMVSTKSDVDRLGSRVRILTEQVEKAGENGVPELSWEFQVTKLESELNKVIYAFQKTKLENLEKELAILRINREKGQAEAKWIKNNLSYDEKDLNENIEALQKSIQDKKERIATLEASRAELEQELIKVQNRIEVAEDPEKKDVLQASMREKELLWDYYQTGIEHAEESLQYLSEAHTIWQQRYALLESEMKTEELYKIRDNTEERIDNLENILFSLQENLSSVHSRLSRAQQELEKGDLPKDALEYKKGAVQALDKLLTDNLEFSSTVSQTLDLNKRLLSEVKSRLSSVQIAGKVSTLGKARIMGILNTEILSGEGYTLTVRKLILALVILILGILLSKKFTNFLMRKMTQREMDPSAIMAVRKIVYYILVIIFILITLNMVNIPLTAFAFLGGALAIAIGFGAQNLFSNLITGFILMFQKPFKINDIVQVGDTVASVVEIGSRATRIRDFDNIEIMVPNSEFLTNRIVNWTHSDKTIRGVVNVGVAYGSPVRQVEELLMGCARSHSKILKKPEPYVVFTDFGSSALSFQLYFWVDMANASRFFVGSDLRYIIDNAFAKNNIVIAFPQLDVHLNTIQPPVSKDEGSGEDVSNEGDKD